jgi:hypothetical protein
MAAGPDEVATKTPIKHFVVLMQAGHSFDNYFGTFPGADGIPAGVCQRLDVNRASTHNCVKPFHLDESTPPENLARGLKVLSRQYNGGRMDGFVSAYRRIGQDGTTAMGYYDESDLPYTWGVAREFVLFDRFFSSGPGPASRSYLDWIDGAPANRAAAAVQPNIFDRLGAKGVSATIYVEGLTPRAARERAARERPAGAPVPAVRPGPEWLPAPAGSPRSPRSTTPCRGAARGSSHSSCPVAEASSPDDAHQSAGHQRRRSPVQRVDHAAGTPVVRRGQDQGRECGGARREQDCGPGRCAEVERRHQAG